MASSVLDPSGGKCGFMIRSIAAMAGLGLVMLPVRADDIPPPLKPAPAAPVAEPPKAVEAHFGQTFYVPPSGWTKKESGGWLIFTAPTADAAKSVSIYLSAGVKSTNPLEADFKAEVDLLQQGMQSVTPGEIKRDKDGEWLYIHQVSSMTNKAGQPMARTYTGWQHDGFFEFYMFSAVQDQVTQDHLTALVAFEKSVTYDDVKKPVVAQGPGAPAADMPAASKSPLTAVVPAAPAVPVVPAVPAAPANPVDERVEKYKSWAAHKVGTSAKWINITEEFGAHPGRSKSLTLYTLKSVSPDEVLLEYTTVTEFNGNMTKAGPFEEHWLAKPPATIHASDDEPSARKPKIEVKESEEDVTVAGHTYHCKSTATTRTTSTGVDHKTVWTSPEVPGRLVREISDSDTHIGDKTLRFESRNELREVVEGK